MKKTIILILLLVFSLCGCKGGKSLMDETSKYLVSAVGFDENDGEIEVSVEALIINSEKFEEDISPVIISGKGASVEGAIKEAYKKSPQPLTFSHCAVAVIGNIDNVAFDEICDYFLNHNEITVSIAMVRSQNAKQLMSIDTESSVAVGYEIANMLKTQNKVMGRAFNNRFFEIAAARAKGIEFKPLPIFKEQNQRLILEDEKNEQKDKLF